MGYEHIKAEWNCLPLSIGPNFFCFKGCWVLFYIFINILVEIFVRKQWSLHCLPISPKKYAKRLWVKDLSFLGLYSED